jgi:two-component system NtrC family sensor kinase
MSENARILVVDDDPHLLRVTTRLLENAGHEVTTAGMGTEGLRLAKEQKPDLILLDVMLPDINGFEVCRRIKNSPELAHIYVVILSGRRIDSDSQAEGLEIGADEYIVRPLTNRELLARVHTMLRLKRAEEGLRAKQEELAEVARQRSEEFHKIAQATAAREARMAELKTVIRQLRTQLEEAGLEPVADDPLSDS